MRVSQRSSVRRPSLFAACCGVVSIALVGGRAAADPAPPPIASVWIGSQDAVVSVAGQVGVPLPPQVSVTAIEQLFPFFHPGDIRTDAPLGMVFLGGENLNQQQFVSLAVPLKAGVVPLSQLPEAVKTDAADTVTIGGVPFRRTTDYLLMMGTVASTPKLDVTPDVAAMKPTADGRTPVLLASVDLAAWRKAAPNQFAAGMKTISQPSEDDPSPGSRACGLYFASLIRDKLNKFSTGVDQTRSGLTVQATLDPFPAAHGSFPRPGLPVDCAARLDTQVTREGFADFFRPLADQPDASDASFAMKVLGTFLLGDAETFGLGMVDGHPVVYCAVQRSAPFDIKADIAAIAKEVDRTGGSKFDLKPYTSADGKTAYRFAVPGNQNTTLGYVDITDRGGIRYATYCPADLHLVERLAALPLEQGTIDTVGSGWVEPAPSMDAIAAFDPNPDHAAATADMRTHMATLLGSARITWTAKSVGSGTTFSADVPTPLLKALPSAMEYFAAAGRQKTTTNRNPLTGSETHTTEKNP